MASLIPKKPPSSASYDDDELPVARAAVTSCLYLKPDDGDAAVRRSLDKDVVLRRIRHRKRVNRIRDAFQSLLRVSPELCEKDKHNAGWLDDAFSSP